MEATQSIAVTTLKLATYVIDLVKVKDFKKYYYENLNYFQSSNVAMNSYLKAVDIPPKFFKENPEETQKELLDNRELFVETHKKYFDKVIVVVRTEEGGPIINTCRMVESEALSVYEKLKTIERVPDKFEHRSFCKDGYITFVVSQDIKNKKDNQVLVVDFPILLNKKVVIHKATYTLPDETFATPIEHIHYLTGEEINFGEDYSDIEEAINDKREFLTESRDVPEPENILREPEVVSLALVQAGTISSSYTEKISKYIKDNTTGVLTTKKLESLVLDYDETVRSYKQVTALRSVSGFQVLRILESPEFKEFIEEMNEVLLEVEEVK